MWWLSIIMSIISNPLGWFIILWVVALIFALAMPGLTPSQPVTVIILIVLPALLLYGRMSRSKKKEVKRWIRNNIFSLFKKPIGWIIIICVIVGILAVIMRDLITEQVASVLVLVTGFTVIGIIRIKQIKQEIKKGKEWKEQHKQEKQYDYERDEQDEESDFKNPFTDPEIPDELKNDTGFIFGIKKGQTIARAEDRKDRYGHKMDGHILVVGGAGSGKSSCIAIPTLLAWKERVFAIDIKGELYENTQHKRPNARVFDPLDSNAWGYNPFYLLDWTDNKEREATAIANALIPMPIDIKDPFWIKNAQDMLTGAILHFHHEGLTFVETIEEILITPIEELIKKIRNSNAKNARIFVNSFADLKAETVAGIYTELSQQIRLYITDESLANSLSKADYIVPADLESADIYISIPEYLLDQWKNLITLMTSQFLTYFEKRPEKTSTPILFLLDEFPRLGKIEKITNGLATLRGKNITIAPILQSLSQLDLIYGEKAREVICDNCAYTAVLNATEVKTQEYFSKRVGTYKPPKTTDSKNYTGFTSMLLDIPTGKGTSTTPEKEPIIEPADFSKLKDVVLLTPYGNFRVDRKPYYKEK